MLSGVETESSSDEEDQNITTEKLKMIVINVCNKVAVLVVSHLTFALCYFRDI